MNLQQTHNKLLPAELVASKARCPHCRELVSFIDHDDQPRIQLRFHRNPHWTPTHLENRYREKCLGSGAQMRRP